MLSYSFNDGGRSSVFDTTGQNDCVTRALAIFTGTPYVDMWNKVHATGTVTRSGRVATFTPQFRDFMYSLGLVFVVTPHIPIKDITFPAKAIALVAGHCFAIIDGVIQDTYNPSPAGLKRCQGYWMAAPTAQLFNVISETTNTPINRVPMNREQAETMAALLKLNYNKKSNILPYEQN
jgi:hypothetical protein